MGASARISVVIVVDRGRPRIETAVRSVLSSDLQELEVLLIEDGPTDPCAAQVGMLQDSRVTTVRLRQGSGHVRARNVGIARAQARYVAFLDPTDLLKPHTLSASVTALDREPQAGFAFSDFETIDVAGRMIEPSRLTGLAHLPPGVSLGSEWRLIPRPQLLRALLESNFIGRSAVALRRQLLTEIGPFDDLAGRCADLDLWFRLAHRCDALYYPRVGYSERLSAADTDRAATADRIDVLRREKQRCNDRAARAQLNRRIAQDLASLGCAEHDRRRRLRALATFASAFATAPDVRWLRGMLRSLLP